MLCNLTDREPGRMQKLAGFFQPQLAEVAPEAASRCQPEFCAKMAFRVSQGLRQLLEAERLIKPREHIAVDPGNEIILPALAMPARPPGFWVFEGAETLKKKPEVVGKQALPIFGKPTMDQLPQENPFGRTECERRAGTQWLDLSQGEDFEREKYPANPLLFDSRVGVELKGQNELGLPFPDVKGVRIQAKLSGAPRCDQ